MCGWDAAQGATAGVQRVQGVLVHLPVFVERGSHGGTGTAVPSGSRDHVCQPGGNQLQVAGPRVAGTDVDRDVHAPVPCVNEAVSTSTTSPIHRGTASRTPPEKTAMVSYLQYRGEHT